MKLRIATGLIALLMFASAAVFARPADNDNDKDNGKVRTLTGCVEELESEDVSDALAVAICHAAHDGGPR